MILGVLSQNSYFDDFLYFEYFIHFLFIKLLIFFIFFKLKIGLGQ